MFRFSAVKQFISLITKIPTEATSRPVLIRPCFESVLTVETQIYISLHFRRIRGPAENHVFWHGPVPKGPFPAAWGSFTGLPSHQVCLKDFLVTGKVFVLPARGQAHNRLHPSIRVLVTAEPAQGILRLLEKLEGLTKGPKCRLSILRRPYIFFLN